MALGEFHGSYVKIIDKQTATGYSNIYALNPFRTLLVHANEEGTEGTITAQIDIYGSLDPYCLTDHTKSAKVLIASIALSGTGTGSDISADSDTWSLTVPWKYVWVNVSSISGTGAKVDVWLSVI